MKSEIDEAKRTLKSHGYSIVTIYNPNCIELEVLVLKGLNLIDGHIDIEENCNKFLVEKAKFILI